MSSDLRVLELDVKLEFSETSLDFIKLLLGGVDLHFEFVKIFFNFINDKRSLISLYYNLFLRFCQSLLINIHSIPMIDLDIKRLIKEQSSLIAMLSPRVPLAIQSKMLSAVRKNYCDQLIDLKDKILECLFETDVSQRHQSEGIVVLEGCLFLIQMDANKVAMRLIQKIIKSVLKEKIINYFPLVYTRLFNLILGQYKKRVPLQVKTIALQMLIQVTNLFHGKVTQPQIVQKYQQNAVKRFIKALQSTNRIIKVSGDHYISKFYQFSLSFLEYAKNKFQVCKWINIAVLCSKLNESYVLKVTGKQKLFALEFLDKRILQINNYLSRKLIWQNNQKIQLLEELESCLKIRKAHDHSLDCSKKFKLLFKIRERNFVKPIEVSENDLESLLATHLQLVDYDKEILLKLGKAISHISIQNWLQILDECQQRVQFCHMGQKRAMVNKLCFIYFISKFNKLELNWQSVYRIVRPTYYSLIQNQIELLQKLLRISICFNIVQMDSYQGKIAAAQLFLAQKRYPQTSKWFHQACQRHLLVQANVIDQVKQTLFERVIQKLSRHCRLFYNPVELLQNLSESTEISERMSAIIQHLGKNHKTTNLMVIRRLILKSQQWVRILRQHYKTLHNKSAKLDQKVNFSPQDGQNVQINNLLGVVLIEMDDKWKYALNSSKNIPVLQLMVQIAKLDSKQVFFKPPFIFERLKSLLIQVQTSQQAKHRQVRKLLKQLLQICKAEHGFTDQQNKILINLS